MENGKWGHVVGKLLIAFPEPSPHQLEQFRDIANELANEVSFGIKPHTRFASRGALVDNLLHLQAMILDCKAESAKHMQDLSMFDKAFDKVD